MIWLALALGVIGLFLSAFFSGSETGFYRAARVRLVLDALGGDRVSRGLVWLTNRPSMFVATTLVGNNLANYMTSLAIVLATGWVLGGNSWIGELLAPIVLAPVLFVYGELLPKYLFLHAPNRLLRRGGPLFLFFTVVFFPVSSLLWVLNRGLAHLLGESPEQVQLRIARRELRGIMEEGHEEGILYPAQQKLAAGIFAAASEPAAKFVIPLTGVARARADMTKAEICGLARRFKLSEVPIEDGTSAKELTHYVRTIDLELGTSSQVEPLRPLITIPADAPLIDALMQLHTDQENLARLVDDQGQTIGILRAARLRKQLLRSR